MRSSKSFIASAAAAAIVSVFGLVYAESAEPVGTGETAQAPDDTPVAPDGLAESGRN